MEEGIQVGELPPTEDVPEPTETSCYRLPSTIVMERRRAGGKKGQTVGKRRQQRPLLTLMATWKHAA